ncbi:8-amino-7-oxononanoate synthase [Taibaiella sp. KBW10]|uniref:aminotransferase class I/II-fold pyridoxal phosphate-dependent enzyme n=1 Tax=Taibaiella sp. KBW10 TaxID=2153357 RepID=UPI000F59C38F|nr:aminotransferase class I/II-fold pyridoxal phosphate-dependent enzyme [Taibaiella sp. KBW10]RQO32542.1 8-amino-7-oxononanoate synthase [Taibaiella sp. KBW10]
MHKQLQDMQAALQARIDAGNYRALTAQQKGIDFYSNDYLGLAQNPLLQSHLLKAVQARPEVLSGSTGSRLISGNHRLVAETESYIASQHGYTSALLFPSGYTANLALCSTLMHRGDTLIVDEYIHRSVHDGCRLSYAHKLKFKHNDLTSLEMRLQKAIGNCYVFIESLYSMDGDFAPIQAIAALTRKYGAALLVDEAHAFGVLGSGLVARYNLQDSVLATVVTYGKALGTHGAALLCNDTLKQYLVNFASPFIYSTACGALQAISIEAGYRFLKDHESLSTQLQQNIALFRSQYSSTRSDQNSPIQVVYLPETRRLQALQLALQEQHLLTYAVYSPTVKAGTERIRICLHSFNTTAEIGVLTQIINHFSLS